MVSSYDIWHVHVVWRGNQDTGFPAQKSKSLGQGMQTLPSNIQVYTAGGGYHYDTIRTISLVDFACPKIENRRQEYLFELEKQISVSNRCLIQRSSKIIIQNGQWKERLQHPSVCIGTGKQLLWRANGSLHVEAFGRLRLLLQRFQWNVFMKPVPYGFCSTKTIFYNWGFCIVEQQRKSHTRLQHDINMFLSTSKSCSRNSFFLLTGTTSIPLGQISFYIMHIMYICNRFLYIYIRLYLYRYMYTLNSSGYTWMIT